MALIDDIKDLLIGRTLDVRWIGVPSWEDSIYICTKYRIGRITRATIDRCRVPERIIEHIEW